MLGCLVSLLSATAVLAVSQPISRIEPNANLHVEGIPPIPEALAKAVAPYTDFRGHSFVAWHPSKRMMLVSHRAAGASTSQLFWLEQPMGELKPLTRHPEPVSSGTIDPIAGRFVIYSASKGGSEAYQLFRIPAEGGEAVQITDERFRHSRGPWLRVNGRYTGEFLLSSVPLDRFLKPEEREQIATHFRLVNPERPSEARVIAELPGAGWFGGSFDRAGTRLLLTRYISANESEVWILDTAKGSREKILPKAGEPPGVHFAGRFTQDGRGLFFVSDRQGEFRELMYYEFASGRVRSLTAHLPHDVEGSSDDDEAEEGDSRLIYTRMNVRGRNELRAFDSKTFAEVPLPGVPAGTVQSLSLRPKVGELALTMSGATAPAEIWTLDPSKAQATRWTRATAPIDMSQFREQEVISWKSFDGLEISGLISRPPARFSGKRPVLINIHGGPEAQARMGFRGRWNYFVNELGITVIEPNVRGSTGFGKTFVALDNGYKREDAVKDIGALLDWIAQQPDLDAGRVLVSGGSYGGYMSLATSVHYGDRIAGAINVVGISHFVTFLETTESYRRDLRRSEYGDERDPKMRAFLDSISPLTNAHRIKKPLFVVQGKNDPRVPVTEAEQIVAKARANGSPVWYLRAENEGHGFARRENADFQFYAMIRFLQETILKSIDAR